MKAQALYAVALGPEPIALFARQPDARAYVLEHAPSADVWRVPITRGAAVWADRKKILTPF